MTSLAIGADDLSKVKADVLVVGATKGPKGPVLATGAAGADKALGGKLAKALADVGFTGAVDETAKVATLGAMGIPAIVAVGLGDAKKVTSETLRRAAGAAVRASAGSKRLATTLALTDTEGAVRAVCEGSLLGAYDFTAFRSELNGRKAPVEAVTVLAREKDRAAVRRAEVVARAVALTRDLVNTPPGDLHPADLASIAVRECTEAGCEVKVLDDKALRKGGYGGIVGVGQGSANGPRLVRIAYTHPRAKRTIALVGKGITFDSGGLSLKPAASMESMKSDMAGAAAVIAGLAAIARLAPPVNVVGWVPTAENMPSGAAIRPGDVLTMYGGKRVEVLNTDAEGRLILADAITRAAEENPDVILDVATLTGAQLVALGTRTAGVMSNDDDLRARVVESAERAGESMWPMPLPPELRKTLDSEIADMANVGSREGGMLVAAHFLKEFVPEGVAWAHLDIAGPAYNTDSPHGYTPKGGTGAAVRTFLQFVEDECNRT